ncbi:MAG: Gfo/Idh/MocA family oxidoreductase [Caldilineaceae bacterium SB0665_bin_25]|nr:Gfo/Idh/MocA family oxidoreductase [Caldilineaceae bacterium SB0665_bin_25]
MGSSPVRIGLIGTGMVAQVMHLPHLFELPELFEVTALCDLSPGTVQAVGGKYGIRRTFSDYRDMLERADVDAVMVLTRDHAEPATDALRAGKHVFIEKPMCHNLDEADELLDAQAQSGCVVQLGHHKIYDPGYVAGRERMLQMKDPSLIRLYDIIGPNEFFLEHYDIVRVDDIDAAENARLERLRLEGLQRAIGVQPEHVMRAYGKMLGLSIHDIYILDGAFGLPERVVSTEIWDGGGAFVSILVYPNNLRCILDTATVRDLRLFDETMTVYAPDGIVSIVFPSPFLKNAATVVKEWKMDGTEFRESTTTASYEEAFKLELIHFHDCIVNGKTPRTPASGGRAQIALLIDMIKAYRA